MDYKFLSTTKLFQNINDEQIKSILENLGYYTKNFKKGEYIFLAGDKINTIGIILSGKVNIERIDAWGNKVMLSRFNKGQVFGETYALLQNETLRINVLCSENSEILFINMEKLFSKNQVADTSTVINNLLMISCKRTLKLSKKIVHTSPKTIRAKLYSYFSDEILKHDSLEFDIPFNRQALADYLSVDRSALSNELSKMKDEGILDYKKNHFRLNENQINFNL